ncbi:uncharacterized protein ARMOST_01246 [Armillaria ostoyae]|uniref:F-box domain-containing protein n=1 Tax=Armillaria ostoyae TaxID=47428 RepID=A0A284QNJ4_ARMOS|nr:uncharacterized protein ARMOST_01246 [Armillaria ostoyae]
MFDFQATGMKNCLMTPIPPELVLEILTYISGCRDNLRACCLVCRVWRRLAQPFIFSELSLSLESHCHPWNRKFATYPHLAQYVTHLNLWGGNWVGVDIVCEDQPPFLEGPATLELLHRLPNIKYLKMNDFFLPSEREVEVLCHFTRLEWLEMYEVTFSDTADLLDLVSQSVNLEVLRIADIHISHTSEDLILHDHVDAVPKRLRNLRLHDPTESLYIFSWLSGGAFDLSDLTDLTLSWESFRKNYTPSPPLSSYIVPFISIVGSGIKHLRLNIATVEDERELRANYMLEHFISTRALSSFTALETLNVDPINRVNQNDARHLVDIERLLHHFTLPCLRKVCVTTRFTLNTVDDLPSYKKLPIWTNLDGLLASTKFPSLRHLLLLIEVKSIHWDARRFEESDDEAPSVVIPPLIARDPWPEHPPTVDDIAAMIAEQMPTLASRGCLTIRRSVISRL